MEDALHTPYMFYYGGVCLHRFVMKSYLFIWRLKQKKYHRKGSPIYCCEFCGCCLALKVPFWSPKGQMWKSDPQYVFGVPIHEQSWYRIVFLADWVITNIQFLNIPKSHTTYLWVMVVGNISAFCFYFSIISWKTVQLKRIAHKTYKSRQMLPTVWHLILKVFTL